MGWMDSGVYGSEYYETPHLDALAAKGIRFTQAYAQPMCSPTRASLMTGQAVARHGITAPACHNPPIYKDPVPPASRNFMRPEQITVAEALNAAGYATGHIGKWHLGIAPGHQPDAQGFDTVFFATPGSGPPGKQPGRFAYFSPYGVMPDGDPLKPGARVGTITDGPDGEYITDRLTDEAIAFIDQHRDDPFFLNLWHYGVHGPWGGKEEYIEHFKGRKDPRGKQGNPIMAAMIKSIDDSIGRVVAHLEKTGLAENTLLIFYSDNGGNHDAYGPTDTKSPRVKPTNPDLKYWRELCGFTPPTSNWPLREGKGTLYEGGIRVPMIAVWKGIIPADKITGAIVRPEDFYPTVLEMLGVSKPARQTFDGSSFAAVLRDPSIKRDVSAVFPTQFGFAVRQGDWKLVVNYYAKTRELYQLRGDIGETNDLAAQNPEKVRALFTFVEDHFAAAGFNIRPNLWNAVKPQ
jgi:arylsulfatase A-like enzyme